MLLLSHRTEKEMANDPDVLATCDVALLCFEADNAASYKEALAVQVRPLAVQQDRANESRFVRTNCVRIRSTARAFLCA